MIRFVEVINETNFNSRLERTSQPQFALGEVWINEKYVVSLREATGYRKLLEEGRLPSDLDINHRFTALTTNNGSVTSTHVVVGELATVAARVNRGEKVLLKG
jgi:hypothetical protein